MNCAPSATGIAWRENRPRNPWTKFWRRTDMGCPWIFSGLLRNVQRQIGSWPPNNPKQMIQNVSLQNISMYIYIYIFGWWFGTFFIFPYIGNNHPNWLIFFRGVWSTNQIYIYIYYIYIYYIYYIYILYIYTIYIYYIYTIYILYIYTLYIYIYTYVYLCMLEWSSISSISERSFCRSSHHWWASQPWRLGQGQVTQRATPRRPWRLMIQPSRSSQITSLEMWGPEHTWGVNSIRIGQWWFLQLDKLI